MSKPPRLRRHRIPPDMYGANLTFLFGTRLQLEDALNAHLANPPTALARGIAGHFAVHSKNGMEYQFICVVRRDTRDYQVSALAHEVLHSVTYTLEHRGVILREGISDEVYCYYVQWLMQQCLPFIR